MERMGKSLDALQRHVAKRVTEILGDDAAESEECELCNYWNTPAGATSRAAPPSCRGRAPRRARRSRARRVHAGRVPARVRALQRTRLRPHRAAGPGCSPRRPSTRDGPPARDRAMERARRAASAMQQRAGRAAADCDHAGDADCPRSPAVTRHGSCSRRPATWSSTRSSRPRRWRSSSLTCV